jgi:hypothetical protein
MIGCAKDDAGRLTQQPVSLLDLDVEIERGVPTESKVPTAESKTADIKEISTAQEAGH